MRYSQIWEWDIPKSLKELERPECIAFTITLGPS